MNRFTKSLKAFSYYLVKPISITKEYKSLKVGNVYWNKTIKNEKVLLWRMTFFFISFIFSFISLLYQNFIGPITVIIAYIVVSFVAYKVNFQWGLIYDPSSPFTYERFLTEHRIFPDRICEDYYLNTSSLLFYIDEKDYKSNDEKYGIMRGLSDNPRYFRIFNPQTPADAVLIFYNILHDQFKSEKERQEEEEEKQKERSKQSEIEQYELFKNYLQKDIDTLNSEIAANIEKCKELANAIQEN